MNAPIRVTYYFRIALLLMLAEGLAHAQISPPPPLADKYTHTQVDKEVTLNVAANDTKLDKIVLTNHGTARIENNQIVFTPSPDFAGVGYVNYTLCDTAGANCSAGLVTIDVAQPIQPPVQYYNLFSKNYGKVTFTLPKGYILNPDQSQLGSSALKETTEGSGIWEFSPNSHTSGRVEAVFYRYVPGNFSQFYVTFYVLKAPHEQLYTKNDMVTTLRSKAVHFNILKNDPANDIKDVVVLESNDGIVKYLGDGFVSFTPYTITSGPVDIYYQITTKDNIKEVAKITVLVSNFEPAVFENVKINATRGEPLILAYNIPHKDFRFNVFGDSSRHGGKVQFYGQYEAEINGQRVTAKNVLVYTPPAKPEIKVDFFTARYELTTTGEEFPGQNVVIMLTDDKQDCYSGCLWPGDADTNGVVDVRDLSVISKNIGTYGLSRSNNGATWKAQPAADWQDSDNDINLKYADTNGDGIISDKDVDVLVQNFKAKNAIQPVNLMKEGYPANLNTVTGVRFGDRIEFDLNIGTSDNPVIDALGISFDIEYTDELIKPGTVSMTFDKESWLARFDSYLSFSKDLTGGDAYAALARYRSRGASGHGQVGKINAVIVEDISGFRLKDNPVLRFKLKNIQLLGADGQITRIPDVEVSIPIERKKGAENEPLKNGDVHMYPNPASDAVNFYLNGVNQIEYIRIMDISGREVSRINNVAGKEASIPTVALARGLYLTEVMTAKGRVVKKLEIIR